MHKISVTLNMSEADFEQLSHTSATWGDRWREQEGRFENVMPGQKYDVPPPYTYRYAYWLEEGYVNVLLARAFLEGIDAECYVLWDSTCSVPGYVILTDYAAPTWQRSSED